VITLVIIKSHERCVAGRTSVLGRRSPFGGPKITGGLTDLNGPGTGVKVRDSESLALFAIHADKYKPIAGRESINNNKVVGVELGRIGSGCRLLESSAASFLASSWSDSVRLAGLLQGGTSCRPCDSVLVEG
jgi:hypothetical protein